MNIRVAPCFRAGLVANMAAATMSFAAATSEVKLTKAEDRVRVEIGGALFTEYIFKGGPKPYLYPVLAADGTGLTRDFPMKLGAPNAEDDHPHHRSLWFAHGIVNGVDFWLEGPTKGTIVNESVETTQSGGTGTIRARNRWVGPDGAAVTTDETELRFSGEGTSRFLDYRVTLHAPADRPLLLGDTKEGTMAIRVPEWMTAPHRFKGRQVNTGGEIVNAEGLRKGAAWGKRSTWVDYHAPREGKIYGVAMFDHPTNPRHPTWWMVREYGLFAANPFGQHEYEPEHKANKHAGDLTVPAGEAVTFRWRFYFHLGDETTAKVADHYQAYAAEN